MGKLNKVEAGGQTVHYVSQRRKRSRPKAKIQPPMTPMIDVTFQLLIFFLVATNFRETEGYIPGTLPEKGAITQVKRPPSVIPPIRITLRPLGQANELVSYELDHLEKEFSDPKELYRLLKARQQKLQARDIPIIIEPWSGVRWQFVVEAYNQVVRAEFTTIGFTNS